MRRIFLIATIMMAAVMVRSQSIQHTSTTNRTAGQNFVDFRLSTTSGNPPLIARALAEWPGIDTTPRSAFVFEYGNGYFTTEVEPLYYYKNSNPVTTVLTLSGRYDTIKPPRIVSRYINDIQSGQTNFTLQNLLETNEWIRITPIATSLNVRDEMLFIITYKVPANTSGMLYFFYNQPSFNVMEALDLQDQTTLTLQQPDMEGINVSTLSRIRTHFGEMLLHSASIGNTGISDEDDYSDLLAWEVPSAADVYERNIFLTIRTKDSFTEFNSGLFKAALVVGPKDASTTVIDTLRMNASANPHDPNYIVAIPKCLVKGTGTMPVDYHLHFQNEGGGSAHRLMIEISLDKRLKEAAEILTSNSFRIIVGNKAITDFTYELKGRKLFFDIKLPKPEGTTADSSLSSNRVENWFLNSLTMGDIYFTLNVPIDKEADFAAHASITFHNSNDDDMDPVITATNYLHVREKCDGNIVLLPTCIICCTKFLWLCWWWWIIIAIGVLLIWRLIVSLKTDKETVRTPVK